MLKSSGGCIRLWFAKNAKFSGRVEKLATDNKMTVQAVYQYVSGNRDIRVYKGAIYEIKKLEGKQ